MIAFSSGTGEGSVLFCVQAGVKTGCPLSSLLFLLGVNPVIDLFLRLSDGPKLSATRVCADDFGSALRYLRVLKVHAAIFALAAKTIGLLLKPEKCVLVFSLGKLKPAFVMVIRAWLRDNVLAFANFVIADSGKYLGWYLGRNSVELSFASPFSKFAARVKDVFEGNAPAATSIIKYNQRCVPVFSYHAQFSLSSREDNFAHKEHLAIHKILHMPPNSMSRDLMRHIDFCSVITPVWLEPYFSAIMLRFALSEKDSLLKLGQDIRTLVGSSLTLAQAARDRLPLGGLDSVSVL